MAKTAKASLSEMMLDEAIRDGSAVEQMVSVMALITPHIDQMFQVRVGGIDLDHVRQLRKLIDVTLNHDLFPIVVWKPPGYDEQWKILNGFHRLNLYVDLEREGIPAYVVDWTEAKAWEYVVGANLILSKSLTTEDKRNSLTKLIENDHANGINRSMESLASMCGVGALMAKNRWIELHKQRGWIVPEKFTTTDNREFPFSITREPKTTPAATPETAKDDGGVAPPPRRPPHNMKTCPMCNGTGVVPA